MRTPAALALSRTWRQLINLHFPGWAVDHRRGQEAQTQPAISPTEPIDEGIIYLFFCFYKLKSVAIVSLIFFFFIFASTWINMKEI